MRASSFLLTWLVFHQASPPQESEQSSQPAGTIAMISSVMNMACSGLRSCISRNHRSHNASHSKENCDLPNKYKTNRLGNICLEASAAAVRMVMVAPCTPGWWIWRVHKGWRCHWTKIRCNNGDSWSEFKKRWKRRGIMHCNTCWPEQRQNLQLLLLRLHPQTGSDYYGVN